MNGIKQLFKGVVIGVVLLLAVIGLLNISGKNEEKPSVQNDIPAPSISINKPSGQPTSNNGEATLSSPNDTESSELATSSTTAIPSDNEEPITENTQEAFKPEIIEEPISYGTLKLSAKLNTSNAPQKVNFLIFDKKNKQIATSENTDNASFKLPTGQFRIVVLLEDQKTTTTVIIRKDTTTNETFAMQAPIRTGVIQVSAISDKNRQALKSSFIIQDKNGKQVGTRQDVSSTVFRLDAGTYKIIAKNGGSTKARTVTVESGESDKEIFLFKESLLPGKILLHAVEEGTNISIKVNYSITHNGEILKQFNSVSNAEISLGAGKYLVRATGPNGQSSRNITLGAGETITETFSFKRPQKQMTETPDDSTTEKENVSTNDETLEEPQPTPVEVTVPSQGTLKLKSVNALNKKAVKSNFYVQTLNGKHIAKKIYTNSASFKLDKGTYKITIKSNNMKTIVKTITIDTDSKLNQIFAMQSILADAQTKPQLRDTHTPSFDSIPNNGTLIVTMQAAKNQKTSRNALLSNFLIKTRAGKKIAQINGVQHANVKLDVGEYMVTATHRNQTLSKPLKIIKNQLTKISFNTQDFNKTRRPATQDLAKKGLLRSRVIDTNGRPLKAHLTVTNLQGKIMRKANNVSTATFKLPANSYTISIRYQELSGNERVRIIAGETTVQTFTIAPSPEQTSQQQDNPSRNTTNSSKEIRDAIKEKLKEELRRIIH